MTTHPDHSQHNMASHHNDFELYNLPSTWSDQPSLPASFVDPTFDDSAPLDAFAAHQQQSYMPPNQHHPAIEKESYLHARHYLRPQSPTYSPSNSAAHSFDYHNPPAFSSISDSGASVQSTLSSAMGSPSAHGSNDWSHQHNMNMLPGIVHHDSVAQNVFATTSFNSETIPVVDKGCVDPSLIQPLSPPVFPGTRYSDMHAVHPQYDLDYSQALSPLPTNLAIRSSHTSSVGEPSPYLPTQAWQSNPAHPVSRRPSISSIHSRHSQGSFSSDDSNKGLCPITTCGRHVKDLKAHMLTHQNERPEKCPIPTCEYNVKGFARKYDKNRHTLTHYKGTMVCGFCPGSGSAVEKSFNRADVFKRHLTSVHSVEQTPPNARRKSPSAGGSKAPLGVPVASGMCSTCGVTFASAQGLYDHVDDCVLRIVQQAEPSEAINEKLLLSVAEDEEVCATLNRHSLPTKPDLGVRAAFDRDEDVEEDNDAGEDEAADGPYAGRSAKSGKGVLNSRKSANAISGRPMMPPRSLSAQHNGSGDHLSAHGAIGKPEVVRKGLTYSRNGVPLASVASGKGSKRRKNYPLSWGAPTDKMRMKKRTLCIYDGSRRLWKDDMMLDAEHEVRIPLLGLGDGRAWVTDLDVQTLNRAEALHNATEEEKGPWDQDLDELLR